ncbi:hypothetical protein TNCV_1957931 [Trichonephila clavipes]|nr:hypothetical protein TNCV_1957931 [Trichonephila clavipes]
MSTKLVWGLKHWGIASVCPPARDICSSTSAPNGYVYWDVHRGSWPSWAVALLSLTLSYIIEAKIETLFYRLP